MSTDSYLRFGQTMSSPPSSPTVDRFIPRREAGFSRDLSNYVSTSAEQEKSRPVENDMSPAKEDYRKALRETILSGDSPKKILMVSSPTSAGIKRTSVDGGIGGSPPESVSPGGCEGIKRKRPARFIPKSPDKILDAPDLVDDYYLNLLDWSSTNTVAVALGQSVFLWNASTGATHKLVETTGSGNIVTSLAWASNGNSLAIGTHSAEVQLWDVEASIEIRRMRSQSNAVFIPFILYSEACIQFNLGSNLTRSTHPPRWQGPRLSRREPVLGLAEPSQQRIARLHDLQPRHPRRPALRRGAARALPGGLRAQVVPAGHPARLRRQRQPPARVGASPEPAAPLHREALGGGQGARVVPVPAQRAGERGRDGGPQNLPVEHGQRAVSQRGRHQVPGARRTAAPARTHAGPARPARARAARGSERGGG